MTRSARYTGILSLLLACCASAQETPSTSPPASVPPVPQAEPEMPAMVQVTGVETLTDYATVGRLLGAVEGVRRVDVTAADAGTVTFSVLVRGGSSVIDRALESSTQLVRAGASDGRLVYEYRR